MNERGWGWTSPEIRQIHLIEWIMTQSGERPGPYVPVKPFCSELDDQAANTFDVAYSDLRLLEERSLIMQVSRIGGIESIDAKMTSHRVTTIENLRMTRVGKRERGIVSRDAIVAWL